MEDGHSKVEKDTGEKISKNFKKKTVRWIRIVYNGEYTRWFPA
jgi:hypothetical protein